MYVLVLIGTIIVASGVGLGLSFRRKKTPAELERERRLKINTIGRICDGSIETVKEMVIDGRSSRTLYYSYSVSGVTYSAAQDLSPLIHHVKLEHCHEGAPASVKYDPHNPSNSIVVCELWSGLR